MMDIASIHEETGAPVSLLCDSIMIPRAGYYRHKNPNVLNSISNSPHQSPKNALHGPEKQLVLDLLHSQRFVDKTPYEVYNTLIDEGEYHCSIRTMYRLLSGQGETVDRRAPRCHRNAVKPELIATRENEVWTWDITKLLCTQRLKYFHLYVILDIYSRYVVGWLVADCESQDIAKTLIQKSALKQGIQNGELTLHADNGASMKSHTVAQLLEHLGIAKTHNRPHTSNDNPFSEAQFKTVKYHPEFPGRFETIEAAIAFCEKFFTWYNKIHYHSGLVWLTPESVHHGQGQQILNKRHQVLMDAFRSHPERFNSLGPQIKELPKAVYINPPQTVTLGALQKEGIMA
jgi:putative transposase